MSQQIRLIDEEALFESERFSLFRERFATPDGDVERALVHHPGSVAIAAELEPGQLLLVRQYRYSLRRETLEIPAGTLSPGEDPRDCAGRELCEESGYQAAQLDELARIYPAVGLTDELQIFYRASGLSMAAQHPDHGEFIGPEVCNQQAVDQAIRDGLICDAKTLLGIQLLGYHWQVAVDG